MPELYPLRFRPVFRQYIWGGRKLKTELGLPIGDDGVYAESWEVVDHDSDQSVVAFGELAGIALHELIEKDAESLIGKRNAAAIRDSSHPPSLRNRFPLLLKILDANRDLSVQVHPNDEQAKSLSPPDLGKTEAWIVMATEPGSRIYAGLRPGTDQESFRAAIAENRVEDCLHWFGPKPGDCVLIPAGTVHALGAGLLILEIQQSSDTTYRIHDWNRTDNAGSARELHIEDALNVIDFDTGPIYASQALVQSDGERVLVSCDKFTITEIDFDGVYQLQNDDDSFRIISVLQGRVQVAGDPSGKSLKRGESALIPACMDRVELKTSEATKLIIATS